MNQLQVRERLTTLGLYSMLGAGLGLAGSYVTRTLGVGRSAQMSAPDAYLTGMALGAVGGVVLGMVLEATG